MYKIEEKDVIQFKKNETRKYLSEGYYKEFYYRVLFQYEEENNTVTFYLLLNQVSGVLKIDEKYSYSGYTKQELFNNQDKHILDILREAKNIVDDLNFPVYEEYMTLQYPGSLLDFKSREEYEETIYKLMKQRQQ